MKHAIASVINFCTNEERFFDRCIEEAKKFSSQIIIPVCDHFFDGRPENLSLLHAIYASHPECDFIQYAYSSERLYSRFIEMDPHDLDWKMYWYATSRYIGHLYLNPDIDYVLFLDTDEIVDGDKLLAWLDRREYCQYEALRLKAYYYFREAYLQSMSWVDNALLAKKRALGHNVLFNDWDRKGAFSRIAGNKGEPALSLDGFPMVHHYSWVKTKEECLVKADTSGHFWEKDFKALIEEEFSRAFQGTDFVFSYDYRKVSPFFDPLAIKSRALLDKKPDFPNVKLVTPSDVFRKEIELEFQL